MIEEVSNTRDMPLSGYEQTKARVSATIPSGVPTRALWRSCSGSFHGQATVKGVKAHLLLSCGEGLGSLF
jgi:hypothetical protein